MLLIYCSKKFSIYCYFFVVVVIATELEASVARDAGEDM